MTESTQEPRTFRPVSAEVLARLREEYTCAQDQRCRVCGAEMMLSNSSTGVYNCTSDEADIIRHGLRSPEWKAAREHYEASAWYHRGQSDKRVLDLIDEIEWRRRGAGRLSDREVAEEFEHYWAPLVTDENGELDRGKLAKEFGDYSWLLRAVPLAYDRATNGRVSQPFTLPEIVGQQTEQWFEEAHGREAADLLRDVIAEMADVLPDDPGALDAVTRHLRDRIDRGGA